MTIKKKDFIMFSLIFAVCFSFLLALACNFFAYNEKIYFAKESISSYGANDTYEVKYDANGGSGEMTTSNFEFGEEKALLSNSFTRKGYTFTGWNTKSNGTGTSYANGAKVRDLTSEESITLYAQWKVNKYNVKYNANGGEGNTMHTSCFTYGDTRNLRYNSFTREGYTFNGWNTKADGTGTSYDDEEAVTNLSEINGETIILYAQWKGIEYTVRYNANDGQGQEMANSTLEYGTLQKLRSNTFIKTGFSFLGWNTQADGKGEYYSDENKVMNLTSTPGDIINLYAIYTDINNSPLIFKYEDNTDVPKDGYNNYIVYNSLIKYTVSYVTDSHGDITPNEETVVINKNPLFQGDTPDSGYKLLMIKCDKALSFNDNSRLSANQPMTPEKFRKAKIDQDLVCNITHKLYTPKNYSCNLANSDGTCN